ncbi:metallophosphoesterase [Luteolibacter ambystomatis]|uniref:Metallophosphoesterase n=1 Tax=Luteolibacter ambystomatis TaxID=2824561 RepID=A0A975PGQ2_9BACT|nr:metallophosphoesterase [Luteolibacter ambystomatis]QUE52958.1 metallophosphoesterase [Luteolibacter ambystomatis]
MNRRDFLWTTVLTGSTPLIARAAEEAPVPAPTVPEGPLPGLPTVTSITPDSVAIVWSVKGPCTGYVEYGNTPELGKTAYGSQDGLRTFDAAVIAIRLPDLKPGDRIYYRTVTAPIQFPNHYKITRGAAVASPIFDFGMPGPATEARIAIWNDIHQQAPTIEALGKATLAFGPDLIVLNGDLVQDQFNKEQDFTGALLSLDSGRDAWSRRPIAFVRGNHDARGSIARDLNRFAPRPHAYGYLGLLRVGPVGVLMLDTGDDKEGPGIYGDMGDFAAYRENQREWLEKAVADPRFASAPFRLLFCHIPLRWKEPESKGAWCSDGDARWSPLLAKARIHAVISGHTHQFWHSPPTGDRPYHQIVSGGPETTSTKWSPTPACLVKIEANANTLTLKVTEALSGTEHLQLELKA